MLDGATVPGQVLYPHPWYALQGRWRRVRQPHPHWALTLLVILHHIGDEHPHNQEEQEASSEWDGNGTGSGQEISVDDMLAAGEW